MPQKTEMKYPTVAEGGWMPQKTEMEYPAVAEGGRMDARNDRINGANGREDGCHKRQKQNFQQCQREGGWMPQKTEMKYPTVTKGGRMDATKARHTITNSGRGKDRNKISNSGRGREGGCHKTQK